MSNHNKTGAGSDAPVATGKQAPDHAEEKAQNMAEREAESGAKPDWANGLKQFYDSVVDEPLPDELSQLLARFDEDEA